MTDPLPLFLGFAKRERASLTEVMCTEMHGAKGGSYDVSSCVN